MTLILCNHLVLISATLIKNPGEKQLIFKNSVNLQSSIQLMPINKLLHVKVVEVGVIHSNNFLN